MKHQDPFNAHFFNLRNRKRSKYSEDFSMPKLNSKANNRYKNQMSLYLPCDLQPKLPVAKMAATIEAGAPSRFKEQQFISPDMKKGSQERADRHPRHERLDRPEGSSERRRTNFQSMDASAHGSKQFVQSVYLKNCKQLSKPLDKSIEEQFGHTKPQLGFEQTRFSQMMSGNSRGARNLETVDRKLNILPIGMNTRGALKNQFRNGQIFQFTSVDKSEEADRRRGVPNNGVVPPPHRLYETSIMKSMNEQSQFPAHQDSKFAGRQSSWDSKKNRSLHLQSLNQDLNMMEMSDEKGQAKFITQKRPAQDKVYFFSQESLEEASDFKQQLISPTGKTSESPTHTKTKSQSLLPKVPSKRIEELARNSSSPGTNRHRFSKCSLKDTSKNSPPNREGSSSLQQPVKWIKPETQATLKIRQALNDQRLKKEKELRLRNKKLRDSIDKRKSPPMMSQTKPAPTRKAPPPQVKSMNQTAHQTLQPSSHPSSNLVGRSMKRNFPPFKNKQMLKPIENQPKKESTSVSPRQTSLDSKRAHPSPDEVKNSSALLPQTKIIKSNRTGKESVEDKSRVKSFVNQPLQPRSSKRLKSLETPQASTLPKKVGAVASPMMQIRQATTSKKESGTEQTIQNLQDSARSQDKSVVKSIGLNPAKREASESQESPVKIINKKRVHESFSQISKQPSVKRLSKEGSMPKLSNSGSQRRLSRHGSALALERRSSKLSKQSSAKNLVFEPEEDEADEEEEEHSESASEKVIEPSYEPALEPIPEKRKKSLAKIEFSAPLKPSKAGASKTAAPGPPAKPSKIKKEGSAPRKSIRIDTTRSRKKSIIGSLGDKSVPPREASLETTTKKRTERRESSQEIARIPVRSDSKLESKPKPSKKAEKTADKAIEKTVEKATTKAPGKKPKKGKATGAPAKKAASKAPSKPIPKVVPLEPSKEEPQNQKAAEVKSESDDEEVEDLESTFEQIVRVGSQVDFDGNIAEVSMPLEEEEEEKMIDDPEETVDRGNQEVFASFRVNSAEEDLQQNTQEDIRDGSIVEDLQVGEEVLLSHTNEATHNLPIREGEQVRVEDQRPKKLTTHASVPKTEASPSSKVRESSRESKKPKGKILKKPGKKADISLQQQDYPLSQQNKRHPGEVLSQQPLSPFSLELAEAQFQPEPISTGREKHDHGVLEEEPQVDSLGLVKIQSDKQPKVMFQTQDPQPTKKKAKLTGSKSSKGTGKKAKSGPEDSKSPQNEAAPSKKGKRKQSSKEVAIETKSELSVNFAQESSKVLDVKSSTGRASPSQFSRVVKKGAKSTKGARAKAGSKSKTRAKEEDPVEDEKAPPSEKPQPSEKPTKSLTAEKLTEKGLTSGKPSASEKSGLTKKSKKSPSRKVSKYNKSMVNEVMSQESKKSKTKVSMYSKGAQLTPRALNELSFQPHAVVLQIEQHKVVPSQAEAGVQPSHRSYKDQAPQVSENAFASKKETTQDPTSEGLKPIDWFNSDLYSLVIELEKLPPKERNQQAKQLEAQFLNPEGLDILTEVETDYYASLLQRKGRSKTVPDEMLLEDLFEKAKTTIDLLSSHLMILNYPLDDDEGTSQASVMKLIEASKGSAIIKGRKYMKVTQHVVIKLLFRCKKLFTGLQEMKKFLSKVNKEMVANPPELVSAGVEEIAEAADLSMSLQQQGESNEMSVDPPAFISRQVSTASKLKSRKREYDKFITDFLKIYYMDDLSAMSDNNTVIMEGSKNIQPLRQATGQPGLRSKDPLLQANQRLRDKTQSPLEPPLSNDVSGAARGGPRDEREGVDRGDGATREGTKCTRRRAEAHLRIEKESEAIFEDVEVPDPEKAYRKKMVKRESTESIPPVPPSIHRSSGSELTQTAQVEDQAHFREHGGGLKPTKALPPLRQSVPRLPFLGGSKTPLGFPTGPIDPPVQGLQKYSTQLNLGMASYDEVGLRQQIREKRKSALPEMIIPKTSEVELPLISDSVPGRERGSRVQTKMGARANNYMTLDPYELGGPPVEHARPKKKKAVEERKIAYEETPDDFETQTYHRKASGLFRSSKASLQSQQQMRKSVDSMSVKNAYGMDEVEDAGSQLSVETKEQRPQQRHMARKV